MAEVAPPQAARKLIARLPRTFGPALNEQIASWDLLFPAEQRRLLAHFDWLARLPESEFERLFSPLVEIESKMELPRWDAQTTGMSVRDVGILARSPLYPKWRTEVERVFGQIDDGVEESGALISANRLTVCVLPAGLPLADQPLWPELAGAGTWRQLDAPFGRMLRPLASALAKPKPRAGLEEIEGAWIFECGTDLSALAESTPATVLSWTAVSAMRREFLNRLNRISRDLKSVDQTNQELRRMDISRLLGPRIGGNPRVREFVRSLLLSGNGSLVFNNSFVQWGAAEALRRVQPQVLLACFGIRPKLKPFSGSVLFEDQSRANPAGEEDDPAGSLVDGLILAGYVHLSAQRTFGGQGRSLTLMAACDLDRILAVGARNALPASARLTSDELADSALRWLASES